MNKVITSHLELDEYIDNLEPADYLVAFKFWDDYDEWYSNEVLQFDGNGCLWVWLDDWDEGQNFECYGFIKIEDVPLNLFEL